ncbi:VF530 family DNA-binding protein [Shewanella aestuarii]|uniref:DUF2132 domain-containing protein n=1 Tax=Shewanella aestuarii TaxID=1028752 RepID=A0A6G9QI79_9GAMM|nr:VF530 family protein [Shewanella aestuarii]QIR14250.1 DUF2132 domain-containing protein [Shewanella aestuarii]
MTQQNNPLHGIKLETIIIYLVDKYGWEELGNRINIRCFKDNPSVKSSLTFLRKTQWARDKVEYLYLKSNKLPLPVRNDFAAKPAARKPSQIKNINKTQSISNSTKNTVDGSVNAHIWGKS